VLYVVTSNYDMTGRHDYVQIRIMVVRELLSIAGN
jgi:hypothetical protein